MKHFKTTTETKTITSRKLVEIECDLCHEKATALHHGIDGLDWGQGLYSHSEVVVMHKTGVSYPDDHSYETKSFHMCPDCFWNKLAPWLEEQGAVVYEDEIY